MFLSKHRAPAVVATGILTAAMVCVSLTGCSFPHYNHRGESIGGAAHQRILQPTIVTGILHGGRR
jgi:hypothetical protein